MLRVFASVAALYVLFGSDNVTTASSGESLQNLLFGGTYQLLDLTHQVDVRTNPWPGGRRFEFTRKFAGRVKDFWYSANDFCTAEHGGTHIDAPYHFNKEGTTVGYVPVTDLVLPLVIVDISRKVNDDANFVLYKDHLDNVLRVESDPKKKYIVIFKFGWAKFYNNTRKYYGNDGQSETGLKFPGLSSEVADWIVNNYKNVVGVGVDTPAVDAPSSVSSPVHVTLAKHGLYNLENVNLQETLPVHILSILGGNQHLVPQFLEQELRTYLNSHFILDLKHVEFTREKHNLPIILLRTTDKELFVLSQQI